MSHEFQVHHLLNELVSLLGVRGADVDIDSYADVLLKNRTPYVTTQVAGINIKFHTPLSCSLHPLVMSIRRNAPIICCHAPGYAENIIIYANLR